MKRNENKRRKYIKDMYLQTLTKPSSNNNLNEIRDRTSTNVSAAQIKSRHGTNSLLPLTTSKF